MSENNVATISAVNAANAAHLEHVRHLEAYKEALGEAGPKLKELILDRAAHDRAIGIFELRDLVKAAYPDGA